ncbi:MAG: DUF6311 domain-containing protein [Lachnospiraceae bacterium]|nr:DUF6311 domain-containing protein [Lachnospiraceae bacterium]
MKSSSYHRNKVILFLAGCALGAACFLWVYGAKILNPVYDAWLFNADMDLKQHYIGFCHYRTSAWRFPLGLIDTLSHPTSVSVIYTDSIPLFALLFKFFSGVLPLHFQYFGIFGLMSFMLMGGISSLLIFRLISKDDGKNQLILSAALSIIYILSFTVLQRMFYHTALGAQWIIVLAIYIWMCREDMGRLKAFVIYCLMAVLCVGIHTYYVPMIASLLLGASLEVCIRDKGRIKGEIVNLAGFCISGILTIYVLGGFYGVSEAYGWGIGTFTANLNTFINPLYGSIILKPMKLFYDFQYEGYSYLGIGILAACICAIIYYGRKIKETGLRTYLQSHTRFTLILIILVVDSALAILPTIAFSDFRILGFNYPGILNKIFGIFRSNGRFIWVPEYLIFTGTLIGTFRFFGEIFENKEKGEKLVFKIMLLFLVFQVLDADRTIEDKQGYFLSDQVHGNLWAYAPIDVGGGKYSEFVFLYNDNDIIMDTAFYAYLNGMTLNNYYYARNIDDEVNANIEGWKKQLAEGIVRDDVIYICRKDESEEIFYGNRAGKDDGREWLTCYELDEEHVIGVAR